VGNYGRTVVNFLNEAKSDCKSSETLAAEIASAPSNEDFLS